MDKPTLLIVEDEGILAANLATLVAALGYGVLGPAATGEEALTLLGHRTADLVLMDIGLAGKLNGIETAAVIGETFGVPIIFLSGYSQEPLLETAKSVAPYGFLVKPVSERELAATIAMSLNRAALDRSLALSRQALEESEARYRHLFENSPVGIFRTTLDGRPLLANREMAAMLGYGSPDEAVRSFSNLADQLYTDPNRRVEFLSQLRERGEVRHFVYQARKRDGTLLWIEMNARLHNMTNPDGATCPVIDGFALDVSAQKEAQQALRESEERFRTIFEHNIAAMLLLDAATGAIVDANPAAAAFYGWSITQLRRMRIQEINTLPSEMIQAQMQRVIGSESTRFEFLHRRADGSTRHVEVFSSLIETEGRQLLYSIVHDITERKQMEEERKLLQAQLAQAQKLEAIGTLAGGIAHDFNNILGIILGYTELAQNTCSAGSPGARYLEQITMAGERAKSLVQQILTFSRQAKTEVSILHPALLVKEMLKMLRPSLPATIEIVTTLDEQAGPVEIDPIQLQQILMNLCTNAFHAMEERGGRLTLTLAVHHQERELPFGNIRVGPGQFARLSVSDTGVGISPHIRNRIFDPFFTTKDPGKGTGMGLSLIHGIVENCKGFVTVDSIYGQGSTFHVHLPLTTARAHHTTQSQPLPRSGSGHILFVDDEVMLTTLGQNMLERLGYRVTICNSGEQALALFSRQPDAFDLVFTDQTMPGMTGIELALDLMRIRSELPVVLCTGFTTQVSEEEALALGVRAFVEKPFNSAQLANLLHSILAH